MTDDGRTGAPAPRGGARVRARRCPACSAQVARDAAWCSLCHAPLDGPGHGRHAVAAADGPSPGAPGLHLADGPADGAAHLPAGGPAHVPAGVPADAAAGGPAEAEAAARRLLAELAVTEGGARLPAELGFLLRQDSPAVRVAVGLAGVVVLTLLGLVVMSLAGLAL